MTGAALNVRALEAQDRSAVAALYRRSGQPGRSEAYWRWKFEPQTPGIHNRWLAFTETEAVFHYAGIPLAFQLSGATVTGVVSVDALTGSESRRRGILTEAAPTVYRSWRLGGAAFTLGLPNQQWGSRTRALGWQALFPLRWLALPLRPFAYMARRLKLPAALGALDGLRRLQLSCPARAGTGIVMERVTVPDVRFDELWSRCGKGWQFCAARSRAFVAWRFFGNADTRFTVILALRDGRPVGYAAYRTSAHGVLLADVFAAPDDPEAVTALIDEITGRLLGRDAEAVLCLLAPGHPFWNLLRDRGFVPRHEFGVELVPFAADLPLQEMREARRWHLTGADFDVV